ncbi:MAG: NAD(P)H-dependent oxidoreductase [Hydrogenophilaceae bacterium]|nr:NAD(P)H-dependent oxidoreductase [Hydrogenophilaceae bacterium]
MTPKILAFAGSIRKESLNRQALDHAVRGAREAGAEVTLIELNDYSMPIYNGDLEESHGLPEAAVRLKGLFKSHHGLLIGCPEYNGSITPLLKNTLDWVSRPDGRESGLIPYLGKWAGLIAASAGNLGGLRGLRHVREILTNLQVMVIPQQMALSQADKSLNDPEASGLKGLHSVGKALAESMKRWNPQ